MGSVLMVLVFVVLPLAAAAWVWWRLRASRATSVLMRWLYAGVVVAGGLTLTVIVYTMCMGLNLDWNAAKLAPIVAMVRAEPAGEPLYQDPTNGVMTAWIYGPVPALLFLPAAMFSRPTPVILTAIAINILCALVPVFVAHWRAIARDQHRDWLLAWLMFGVFLWISLMHESLRRAIYIVGPDGPAIGLAVLSIALLFGKRTNLTMGASALCAVLACWSKQTMLPFVLAAPIYLLLVDRRDAIRYVIGLVVIGVVVSGIFILMFGPWDNMRFHMVTISRHHPWQDVTADPETSKLMSVWRAFAALLEDSAEMIVALLAVLLILFVGGAFRPTQRRLQWIAENPWLMFVFAGALLVPSAILGYVKVGGYVNNFALFGFMITLAATTAMAMNFSRLDPPALREFVRALACGIIIVRAVQVGIARGNYGIMWSRISSAGTNQQEYVYNFAKAHPGLVYFPWNNLSTLLAEKRLYHFEWGIVDRYYTPYPWNVEQVRAHIPPDARAIAFGPLTQSFNAAQLFPNATQTLPERGDLPGFVLLAEPGTTLPPPKDTAEKSN